MPKHAKEGEAIEGQKIFCTFRLRPSFGIERVTGRQQIAITGNPATATVTEVWKYKEN